MVAGYGPCMCGATDCPSCGPAQGYEIVKVWDARLQRYVWRNPDPEPDYSDIKVEIDDGFEYNGGPIRCSLAEFFEENADSLDDDTCADLAELGVGESRQVNGGASLPFVVRRVA